MENSQIDELKKSFDRLDLPEPSQQHFKNTHEREVIETPKCISVMDTSSAMAVDLASDDSINNILNLPKSSQRQFEINTQGKNIDDKDLKIIKKNISILEIETNGEEKNDTSYAMTVDTTSDDSDAKLETSVPLPSCSTAESSEIISKDITKSTKMNLPFKRFAPLQLTEQYFYGHSGPSFRDELSPHHGPIFYAHLNGLDESISYELRCFVRLYLVLHPLRLIYTTKKISQQLATKYSMFNTMQCLSYEKSRCAKFLFEKKKELEGKGCPDPNVEKIENFYKYLMAGTIYEK